VGTTHPHFVVHVNAEAPRDGIHVLVEHMSSITCLCEGQARYGGDAAAIWLVSDARGRTEQSAYSAIATRLKSMGSVAAAPSTLGGCASSWRSVSAGCGTLNMSSSTIEPARSVF
jgi:hypothetical protein